MILHSGEHPKRHVTLEFVSFSRRKPLAASCMAAAVQRIAIEAERHRFTLRQTRRTVPITFSIMLVQASERRSSFGNPSRVTVAQQHDDAFGSLDSVVCSKCAGLRAATSEWHHFDYGRGINARIISSVLTIPPVLGGETLVTVSV